jgi:hypothetical protein
MELGKRVVNYYIRTYSLFNIRINPELEDLVYRLFITEVNDNVIRTRNDVYRNLYMIWF